MPCEQVLLFPSAEPPCSLIFSRTRPACARTRIHAHAHAHTPLRDVSLPRCVEGASGPVCASRQPLPLSAAPESPGPHSPTSLILGGGGRGTWARHMLCHLAVPRPRRAGPRRREVCMRVQAVTARSRGPAVHSVSGFVVGIIVTFRV